MKYTEGNKEGVARGGGPRAQVSASWLRSGFRAGRAKLLREQNATMKAFQVASRKRPYVLTRMWTEQSGWPPLNAGVS